MAKERVFAIVIGLIMVMSVAGFAINSAVNQGAQKPEAPKIPTIIDRPLTTEEAIYILNYEGKVIIEYFYQNGTNYQDRIALLESFAQKQSDFVVLQEVQGNETSLNIVGAQGKIVDIGNMTLTEQSLMETFCSVAIAQPPECLMNEI